jgi:glutamine---fructose-6-phosphate transaminase (isomerizing)
MCGIVGYVGRQSAAPLLLEGLRRLEYRGYDSAGLAVLREHELQVLKRKGKIDVGLNELMASTRVSGSTGIGHTRWATHGQPSDENSHPHLDQSGRIALVHNGVIENYERLKGRLLNAGHIFASSTDTEVLAHLIGEHYARLQQARTTPADVPGELLTRAVTEALKEVIGTYGIAVVCADSPGVLVGARRGSPLILGVGEGEHFLTSDASAIVAHTRQAVYLNDYDVVTVTSDRHTVTNLGNDTAIRQITEIEFSSESAERGNFPHFMLKEIFEQPVTVENAMRGRLDFEEATAKFGGLNMTTAELRAVDRIVIIACGTSWHAGLVGEYLFEDLAQVPVEVEYASEFRYRNPPLDKNTLVLAITQSGETADTLAGVREAKRRGHKVLAICNVVGSTIAREADGGIYLHAGPEIGVASTKAFTSQVTVLALLALHMGRIRMLSSSRGLQMLRALQAIPAQIQSILHQSGAICELARQYAGAQHMFYLGRLIHFPVALEGALKLKEISYIHAQAYPAAEMKHGPIALIDEHTPSVVLAPSGPIYEKLLSNLQVVKARKGPVIAVATDGNTEISQTAEEVLYVPETLEPLSPLLSIIPLQLLAYHIAVLRGCDVDKPRNLAKSVTVE